MLGWFQSLLQIEHRMQKYISQDPESRRLEEDASREKACQLFALLQGAMMGAKGQNNPAYFDVVVKAVGLLI